MDCTSVINSLAASLLTGDAVAEWSVCSTRVGCY